MPHYALPPRNIRAQHPRLTLHQEEAIAASVSDKVAPRVENGTRYLKMVFKGIKDHLVKRVWQSQMSLQLTETTVCEAVC